MTLAGQAHILPAMQNYLDRPLQQESSQSNQGSPGGGLVLLTPKGASQSQHLDLDLVHGQAKYPGHCPLHHGRALGRGYELDCTIITGERKGSLSFQVYMFLGTGFHPPLHNQIAVLPGFFYIA
ncbi:hypothetical protein ES703_114521 [subsurface metagenome]